MKKYIKYRILGGFLSALVAVFAFGSSQVYAAPDVVRLYVAPGSQSVVSGNSVTVQVRLSKAANSKVDYAKADMTFSTNQLEIVSVSRSGSYFNATGGPVTSFNNSKGVFTISGSGDTMPTNADVLVASVTMRAKSAGTGSISFTNASLAGDLLGSGSVKNALTATSGASVAISSPPASPPPATTQPKPSSPTPSQSTTPAPTPTTNESAPDATATTPIPDESAQPRANVQPEEVSVVDNKMAGSQPVQLWQWVLSAVITLGALGGIAYVLIARKREHDGVLPDSISEPLPPDTPTEMIASENDAAEILAIGSAESTVAEDESEAEPLVSAAAMVFPVQEATVAEPVSVAGVEIEPLDSAWPTRLNPAPPIETPPVADVPQNIQVEQVVPIVQPEPQPQTQVVEPVYTPQTPVVPVMQPPTQPQQPQEVVPPASEATMPVQQETVVTPQQADEFPDMFEEGAARLTAEGLDDQLKPKPVT